jgi:hypothetical protein
MPSRASRSRKMAAGAGCQAGRAGGEGCSAAAATGSSATGCHASACSASIWPAATLTGWPAEPTRTTPASSLESASTK